MTYSLLNDIAIVLVEPSHPGNIGAVARAMKTMGLANLVMVNPKKFPHYEATKRAAGAESVLESGRVVTSVQEAVSKSSSVIGTSVREREVTWPTFDPKIAAQKVVNLLTSKGGDSVAVLFGRESSGLTNDEMDLCDFQIRIPANDEYSSLNLASAVQIICYEMRQCVLSDNRGANDIPLTAAQKRKSAASKQERQGHLQHLEQVLHRLEFIKAKPPTVLVRKLTRLYNKAELSVEEVHILRGILTAVEQQLDDNQKS